MTAAEFGRRGRLGAKLALLAGGSLLGLALAEGSLRAIGFSFGFAPERVEFGYPDPVVLEDRFETDPDLFWVPPGYHDELARYAREGQQIVFMGDSCTAGPYPNFFLRRARAAHPGATIEGRKLGVAGWTSYQGLVQLKRDVLPLRPRAVTLFYGWNDHWIGFGVEDKEIRQPLTAWLAKLEGLRTVQLLQKTRLALQARDRAAWPARVAPGDFRANLTEMIELARGAQIVPVLLTAPTSHEVGREPEYLAKRHLRNLADLVPLHQRYVEIVRDVAAAEDAVLCDLAAHFDGLPRTERGEDFMQDGIHLTVAGNERVAELLMDCFETSERLRGILEGSGTTAPGSPPPPR